MGKRTNFVVEKTKTLTCQGRGKEEELASAASPFVLKIIEV